MATEANIASPTDRLRLLASLVAGLGLLAAPLPVWAQGSAQSDPATRLDQLIPESATTDPEAWARDDATPAEPADTAAQELKPDSPMDPLPEMSVQWPDSLDLPPLQPLTPEAGVEFAQDDNTVTPLLADARVERIGSEVSLAFPQADSAFPVRDAFVQRFKQLSTLRELGGAGDNIAQMAARARKDQQLLESMLRVYGYYDAQVIRSLGNLQPGDKVASGDPLVRFDIIPGARYHFGTIDLGDLSQAPNATQLRGAFGIQTGDPLSSDRIVEGRTALDVALGETGYPFAKIGRPSLLVDHDREAGDLTMAVTPGGKYVFAGIHSSLPDFLSDRHLQVIARFKPGQTYQRSEIFDLRRAITATGLVSAVTITPREVTPPVDGNPGQVAVDVDLVKAPLRTVSGAIGYGTREGFRLEAAWEHRNLFPSEGSLRVHAIAGTQEQLGGVTFRKNNFRGRDQILTFDAYIRKVDTDAYYAKTAAVTGVFERTSTLLFQKPVSWSTGFELIATDEREAKVKGAKSPTTTYFIAALPARIQYDTSDSLLDPTHGYRLGLQVSPEFSHQFGTNSTYLKAQFDGSVYLPVQKSVVMASRVRLGTIVGAPIYEIAPSRRFYAGGGASVRGYGYQAIGPRDGLGDPNGGRSLAEFSLEARVKTGFMDGAVSVVPFLDAGTVSRSSTPDFQTVRFGAGLGLRYNTTFGPIRVDVGTPLNPGPYDSPIAVYVSLGQAF